MSRDVVVAVVLNWRDEARTKRCVGGILASEDVEMVFVVDNESSGLLREWADELSRVALLENERNLGFAAGVNLGLGRALETNADSILVVNNDAVLAAGCLVQLRAALARSPWTGMVGPRFELASGRPAPAGGRFDPRRMIVSESVAPSPEGLDFLTWATVLLRRQALEDCGLLDESSFMYWEDVEFAVRLRSQGYLLRHVEDARVMHEKSSSAGLAGSRLEEYSTFGMVRLARRQRSVMSVGYALARAFARAARGVAARDGTRSWRVLRGAALGLVARGAGADVYPRVLSGRGTARS